MVTRYQYHSCFIKNPRVLENITEESKKTLVKHSALIIIQKKNGWAKEFKIEDRVYLLEEGKALLSCLGEDGKKIILDILEEGSIFGDLDFSGKEKYKIDCLFIEPFPKNILKICEIKKEEFLNILSKNPALAVHILSMLSLRISALEGKVSSLALSGLKTRILSELIRLGQPYVDSKKCLDESCRRIGFKISHESLAQMTGAVRESVSKAVAELKRDGFIFLDQEKHMIVNLGNKTDSNLYS